MNNIFHSSCFPLKFHLSLEHNIITIFMVNSNTHLFQTLEIQFHSKKRISPSNDPIDRYSQKGRKLWLTNNWIDIWKNLVFWNLFIFSWLLYFHSMHKHLNLNTIFCSENFVVRRTEKKNVDSYSYVKAQRRHWGDERLAWNREMLYIFLEEEKSGETSICSKRNWERTSDASHKPGRRKASNKD